MKVFYLEDDNRIRPAFEGTTPHARPSGRFSSKEELARVTVKLPMSQLLDVWNKLPGVQPLCRFRSRSEALQRIWAAVESLPVRRCAPRTPVTAHGTNAGQSAGIGARPRPAQGKTAKILTLLMSERGASIEEIMGLTGWQKHSVRGFLTGVVKRQLGLNLVSAKNARGVRLYRVILSTTVGGVAISHS